MSLAEQLVRDGVGSGVLVDLSTLRPGERTISGALLEDLILSAPSLPGALRPALRLKRGRVTGSFVLAQSTIEIPLEFTGCEFEGPVSMAEVRAPCLRMSGCTVPGLDLSHATIDGNLDLDEGFEATEIVSLVGARVGGDLRMGNARLSRRGDLAPPRAARVRSDVVLAGSRLKVEGAFLARELVAEGQLRLVSARIGGLFSLAGATLTNPDGIALHGERMELGESLLIKSGFRASGRVYLLNATIKGGLDAVRSGFADAPRDKSCVQLRRITVGRNANFEDASFAGSVDIGAAAVSGQVSFLNARFTGDATHLDAARSRETVLNLRFADPPASADLSHATIGTIQDDAQAWPGSVELSGCAYEVLEPRSGTDVSVRLEWLRRSPKGYQPQPYDELASAMSEAGDERDAARVRLEKERQRRATLSRPGRWFGVLQDVTVGYGYRSWQALLWLLGLVALGAFTFSLSRPEAKQGAPPLQPVVFAFDLLVPILDLDQADSYTTAGLGRWVGWLLVVSGWALTTAFVAGVSRHLSRT